MHLVFATRGIKHQRDIFVALMQSQFFTWKRKNTETGKDEDFAVQGALRPIELWEYVFPEEHWDDVATALQIGQKGEIHPFAAKFNRAGLRKALGLKKIPKHNNIVKRLIPREGLALYPIGIKKDKKGKWDKYEQEML